MLKILTTTAAFLLISSALGCADRSATPPAQTSGQAAAASGTSANVSEEQIIERLQSEGLRSVHLQKEAQGWTANAVTPDFRPVTILLDEHGNALGARTY